MNINILLGFISFVVWSAFSTWYYVNHIKDFGTPVKEEAAAAPQAEASPPPEPATAKDTVAMAAGPAPVNISRQFTFHKNSTEPIAPQELSDFLDSLQTLIGGRQVQIVVTGYTCDLGSENHNLDLGRKRADKAAQLLKAAAASLPLPETTSRGEADPALPNTSEANRQQNRRVTITITSQL